LHFEDIRVLLDVLNRLVDKGNTVAVIEHNMEVIKVADHIIDLDQKEEPGEVKSYVPVLLKKSYFTRRATQPDS